MRDSLFVLFQRMLPRYTLTRIIYRLARVRRPATKNYLINRFIRMFDVELDDVLLGVPDDFETFNDFFIRELKPGARPVEQDPDGIVSPVDGTVSQAGKIVADAIFQAKGFDYSLRDLLATNLDDADRYRDGRFATIYLAPYNYHRVHAPIAGELTAMHYVPGELYSVNAATAKGVNGLFSRNERLILHIDTVRGPAVLVFVGALNVGSITTPWSGEIKPSKQGMIETLPLNGHSTTLQKGDLLGWFNMGSTVILLLPDNTAEWNDPLEIGQTLQMGQQIGCYTQRSADTNS